MAPSNLADKSKKTASQPSTPEVNEIKFEAALTELEQIVHTMEDGRLPLEESIAAYRRGVSCSGIASSNSVTPNERSRFLKMEHCVTLTPPKVNQGDRLFAPFRQQPGTAVPGLDACRSNAH